MMNPTIYIETTIPSYLAARQSSDVIVAGKQETTRLWWNTRRPHYVLTASQFVLDEATRGNPDAAQRRLQLLADIPLLLVDEEAVSLTQLILQAGVIPQKAAFDAAHIAVATRHGVDFLLTWNCTHIANAEIMRTVRRVIENAGYAMPVICTPHELFGGESDD